MNIPTEMAFFLEHGYLHVQGLLEGAYLDRIVQEFDRVWQSESKPVSQNKLLKYPVFVDLMEHPPLLDRLRAAFGFQLQLLQADISQQDPGQKGHDRGWHRDFVFRGDAPVAINTLIYLDPMNEERGPTRVVPGTHRGDALPPPEVEHQPIPGEVAIYARPGDAVFINAAIWHAGGVNRSDGLRRMIYYYYGYWWLRRYDGQENGKHDVPWQALRNASQQRLELLGIKPPDASLVG